ncbi:MAG: radical SAM protein [Clostridiales bacterium]|nr:radical SAM protein [Clostridiales bacterium]
MTISFEITHACNANCHHCHLGGGVKEDRASAKTYAEICRRVKPVIAQFSGGEPLLRQDLEEIVKAVRVPERAPYIVVTTNAALLTRKRYDGLRESGVDEFSISLDYPDERHDAFRRIPGLFGRIKALVEGLSPSEKNHITLCCVIQRDNFRDLPRMSELALEWNVSVNFSCYTPLRTHDEGYMIPRWELDEFREITRRLVAFRKQHDTVFTSEYSFKNMAEYFEQGYFPRCRTGEKFCNVNPDGTFSPCGLIITNFKTLKGLKTGFSRTNTCVYCLTSIRANCEQPLWRLAWNVLESL